MAAVINNSYRNGKINGGLNILFVVCGASTLAGDVYNRINPKYRSQVTIVGGQGMLKWEIATPSYKLRILMPVGGWVRYP